MLGCQWKGHLGCPLLVRVGVCLCCHFVFPFCFGTAPYFEKCISEQDLDEVHIEIIRNTLYKVPAGVALLLQHMVPSCCSFCTPAIPPPPLPPSLTHTQAYLEDFHRYCKELGGTTADVMCPLLEVGGRSRRMCVS